MRNVVKVLAAGLVAVGLLAAGIFLSTVGDATQGDGWRLAASTRGAPWSQVRDDVAYGVVIWDDNELAEVWTQLALSGAPPQIDFERQVVMRATAIGSGSCPLHLDEVRLAPTRVSARASRGFWLGCTADAAPYSFLVIVDRNRLPATPFEIQVTADDWSWEAVQHAWERHP